MHETEFEEQLARSDDPEVQQMWASGEPMNGLWDMIRIQLQLQRTKLNATDICTDKINIILVYEYALIPADRKLPIFLRFGVFGIAAQLCHDLLFGDSDLYKRYITSRPEVSSSFSTLLFRVAPRDLETPVAIAAY
uniref:FERM domain-containing protein n=1 Tax=Macrostomum lignano TaxID=282301 RepID=A0A1I8JQT9_9PLAT